MVRWVGIIAGLLCAAAGAQQRTEPTPSEEHADAGAGDGKLSKEDAELVKDLAVLERMDLLRNLELFEDPKEPQKEEQRQQ
jgi:hypothetical protein